MNYPSVDLGSPNAQSILVVDADPQARAHVVACLEDCARGGPPVTVLEAESGRAALQMTERETVDCAIVDYLLPDYDGLCLLGMMRSATDLSPIPTILVSDEASASLAVQALHAGASDYLVKSRIDSEQLDRSLRHAVERAALLRAVQRQHHLLGEQKLDLERRHEHYRQKHEELAHQLLTPLASVQEFVSLVMDGAAGPITDDQGKFLAYARGECGRIQSIVESLVVSTSLDKAVSASQSAVPLRTLNVGDLVEDVVDSFRLEAELRGLTLGMSVDEGLPKARLDVYEFKKLLSHLLVNALHVSHEACNVLVTVERERSRGASPSARVTVMARPSLSEQFSRRRLQAAMEALNPGVQVMTDVQYIVESEIDGDLKQSFSVPLEAPESVTT